MQIISKTIFVLYIFLSLFTSCQSSSEDDFFEVENIMDYMMPEPVAYIPAYTSLKPIGISTYEQRIGWLRITGYAHPSTPDNNIKFIVLEGRQELFSTHTDENGFYSIEISISHLNYNIKLYQEDSMTGFTSSLEIAVPKDFD